MTFSLEVNTSAGSVTIPNQTAIASGVRVIASGSFTMEGMTLAGAFTFTAGTQTINSVSQPVLSMASVATLQLRAGATRVFDLNVKPGLADDAGCGGELG